MKTRYGILFAILMLLSGIGFTQDSKTYSSDKYLSKEFHTTPNVDVPQVTSASVGTAIPGNRTVVYWVVSVDANGNRSVPTIPFVFKSAPPTIGGANIALPILPQGTYYFSRETSKLYIANVSGVMVEYSTTPYSFGALNPTGICTNSYKYVNVQSGGLFTCTSSAWVFTRTITVSKQPIRTSVTITWVPINGVKSYDVLRTNDTTPPSGNCNCAVSIETTSTKIVDSYETLFNYTVSSNGHDFVTTNEIENGESQLITKYNGNKVFAVNKDGVKFDTLAVSTTVLDANGVSSNRYSAGTDVFDNTYMQLLSLTAMMEGETSGDFSQLRKCIAAAACTVVFWGDSIAAGTAVALENTWPVAVAQILREKFPSVNWTFLNYSLAGMGMAQASLPTYVAVASPCPYIDGSGGFCQPAGNEAYYNWPSGSTAGKSWRDHVKDATPDAIILALGINDVGASPSGFASEMNGIAAYIATWTKKPTLIVAAEGDDTNVTRSGQDWTTYSANNSEIADVIRNWAHIYNYPLMDANRIYQFLRDGSDNTRRRLNLEAGAYNWGNGTYWATADSTLTYSGSTFTAAGGWPAIRKRLAQDVVFSATFSGLGGASVPTFWYRINPAAANPWAGEGYAVQIQSGTAYLYFGYTGITSAPCTVSGGSVAVLVRVQGARHQVFCGGTKVIDVYDFSRLRAGYVGFGVQSGAGTIASVNTYFGMPSTARYPLSGEHSTLGLYSAASESGGSDYYTNPFSVGGDGIHHPSMLGHDAVYVASFMPVLHQIEAATQGAQKQTSYSIYGSSGFAGLFSSGDGNLDIAADSTGGRFISSAHDAVWGTFSSTIFAWNGYIQSGPQGFVYNGTAGYTGTKTAGTCVLEIKGGIVTNVTGC